MVDKRVIEQVLSEQNEELSALLNTELCTRKKRMRLTWTAVWHKLL